MEIIYSQVRVKNDLYVGVCVGWVYVWTEARTDGQVGRMKEDPPGGREQVA